MDDTLVNKLAQFNQVVLECAYDTEERKIMQRFVQAGRSVLGADFGFAWLQENSGKDLELLYACPDAQFKPAHPTEKAIITRVFFDHKVRFVEASEKEDGIEDAMKRRAESLAFIPVSFAGDIFGVIAICYKNKHRFSKEDSGLCRIIGSSSAQAIAACRAHAGQSNTSNNADAALKEAVRVLAREVAATKPSEEFSSSQDMQRNDFLMVMNGDEVLRKVVEDMFEGVLIADGAAAHRIIYVNPAWERITGWKSSEVVGKRSPNVLKSGKMDRKFYDKMWQTILHGDRFGGQVTNRKKDGSFYQAEIVISPLNTSKGVVYTEVSRDVTASRKAEDQLRSANDLLEKVFSNIHVHIAYMDRNFNFIRVNAAYAAADGHDPEYYAGKNHFELFPNEENLAIFRKVIETGQPYFVYAKASKYSNRPESGITYWDWSLEPIKNLEREVTGLVLSLINVTARKSLEVRLEQHARELETRVMDRTYELEERFLEIQRQNAKDEAVLSSIGEGLIVTSADGCITMVNRQAKKMLGVSSENVLQRPWHEVWRLEDENGAPIPYEDRPLSLVLKFGRKAAVTSTTHVYAVRMDGTRFPVAITASPTILGEKIIGAVEVFRDTTQEILVDRAKSEFVALASHQLRTPPSIVNWHSEVLLSGDFGPLNDSQREYMQEIYRANKRMIDLINSLLNTSKIEMGTLTLDRRPLELGDMARSVAEEMQPLVERQNIRFSLDICDNMPPIDGDKKFVRMIFQNLLANAIKYTPTGGSVDIRLECRGANVLLTVADTGFGIPANQQEKIFTKLFRADNIRERDPDGSGLGLYIVRAIVKELGGSIWYTSEENKGTIFYVSIPASGGGL